MKKLSAMTDLHIYDSEGHKAQRERESIDKQIHLKMKCLDINENKKSLTAPHVN